MGYSLPVNHPPTSTSTESTADFAFYLNLLAEGENRPTWSSVLLLLVPLLLRETLRENAAWLRVKFNYPKFVVCNFISVNIIIIIIVCLCIRILRCNVSFAAFTGRSVASLPDSSFGTESNLQILFYYLHIHAAAQHKFNESPIRSIWAGMEYQSRLQHELRSTIWNSVLWLPSNQNANEKQHQGQNVPTTTT